MRLDFPLKNYQNLMRLRVFLFCYESLLVPHIDNNVNVPVRPCTQGTWHWCSGAYRTVVPLWTALSCHAICRCWCSRSTYAPVASWAIPSNICTARRQTILPYELNRKWTLFKCMFIYVALFGVAFSIYSAKCWQMFTNTGVSYLGRMVNILLHFEAFPQDHKYHLGKDIRC